MIKVDQVEEWLKVLMKILWNLVGLGFVVSILSVIVKGALNVWGL